MSIYLTGFIKMAVGITALGLVGLAFHGIGSVGLQFGLLNPNSVAGQAFPEPVFIAFGGFALVVVAVSATAAAIVLAVLLTLLTWVLGDLIVGELA